MTEIHGEATAFYQFMPDLDADEEAALRESIRSHGVLQAVLTDENGRILDGHNRARIAAELGIGYIPEIVTGLDEQQKIDLAFSQNMAHRHLSSAQKREAVRRYLRARPDATDRGAAKILGVSHPTVSAVRDEIRQLISNGKIFHKELAAGNGTPAAPVALAAPPVPPATEPERTEASGRKSRGRKPDSPQERERKAAEKAAEREAARIARAAEKAAEKEQEARWAQEQEAIGGALAPQRQRRQVPDYDRIKGEVDTLTTRLMRLAADAGWDRALAEADRERPVENRLSTSVKHLVRAANAVRAKNNGIQ